MDKDSQKLWDEVVAERSLEIQPTPAAEPGEVIEPVATDPTTKEPVETLATEVKPLTTEELLTQALARVEKLEGRTRNVEGHIGNLTSQQIKVRETLDAAQAASKQVSDAPTGDQVKKAIANPEQWESLKADFPEWSEATEAFMDAKLAGLKAGADEETVARLVQDTIAKAKDTMTGDLRKEIVNASLDAVFPGWEDEVKTDAFGAWLQSQAAEVKTMAQSAKVGDAARMLSLYEEAKKTSPTQQLLDKRQKTLENAVAAPRGGRNVPAKSTDQMTTSELWDYEARQRAKFKAAN